MNSNKKGNYQIPLIMAGVFVLILVSSTYLVNGNGVRNWLYPDAESFTPEVETCSPKKYLIEMTGAVALLNQKESTWTLDYTIDYMDTRVDFIKIKPLSFLDFVGLANTFTAEVCLESISNRDKYPDICQEIKGEVTKGQMTSFPFSFTYNLYDNDCNNMVDDHTFNMRTTIYSEDKTETFEKTVAIVKGNPVFQNAKI